MRERLDHVEAAALRLVQYIARTRSRWLERRHPDPEKQAAIWRRAQEIVHGTRR